MTRPGDARPSWAESEAAAVAELARDAMVQATGQRGLRVVSVEFGDDDTATASVVLLDGVRAGVTLRRAVGVWRVVNLWDPAA